MYNWLRCSTAFQNKKVQALLLAFSLLSNGKKLCQTTTYTSGGEQILIFHGIKVVSMMWIVAGHAAAAFSELPVTDRELVENVRFYHKVVNSLLEKILGNFTT